MNYEVAVAVNGRAVRAVALARVVQSGLELGSCKQTYRNEMKETANRSRKPEKRKQQQTELENRFKAQNQHIDTTT